MTLTYKEVKSSPLEQAKHNYWFICKDLEEGLNYQVSSEVYNQSMKGIGSSKKIDDSETVDSQTFAEDFYSEWTKLGKP